MVRGTLVESQHTLHAAVVDAAGQLRAWAGDPELITFFRSAAKPLQTLPLVEDGAPERLGITAEELALCCGSHSGERRHLRTARRILERAGLDSEALACGPHPPFHEPSRRELEEAGLEPGKLHNNCSGKHAGMLALARLHGWEVMGYERPEHPVQRRVLSTVSEWTGMPYEAIALGVDGCGVLCFAVPLRSMAFAYARLASAARLGQGSAAEVIRAMTAHPEMVAGEGRLCTDLMRRTEGRVVAKIGAEGVYCVGVPGAELGIALKVEDGARRAVAPAILSILRQLDLISEEDLGVLHSHAFPEIRNTRGEVVGELRPNLRLRTPDT